jgi:hypothetical protein
LFENSIMYLNGPPGTAALWSRIGRKRTLRGQGKINAIGTSLPFAALRHHGRY